MYMYINFQSNMMEHVDCYGMKELRFIDLSDNRLASIHGLDHCPSVLELCLSDNRIARVGDGLTSCSGLQLLNMDSNLLINSRVKSKCCAADKLLIVYSLCMHDYMYVGLHVYSMSFYKLPCQLHPLV